MATVSSPDIRHTRRVALKVLNPERGAVLGGLLHVVHPWLGNSDEASRAKWRRALARRAARKPRVVVAGHKKSLDLPDSPEVLSQMDRYLADFDSLRKVNTLGPELYQAMLARYPDLAVAMLLRYASRQAYRKQ